MFLLAQPQSSWSGSLQAHCSQQQLHIGAYQPMMELSHKIGNNWKLIALDFCPFIDIICQLLKSRLCSCFPSSHAWFKVIHQAVSGKKPCSAGQLFLPDLRCDGRTTFLRTRSGNYDNLRWITLFSDHRVPVKQERSCKVPPIAQQRRRSKSPSQRKIQ